jgi:hypothetical protein
MLLQLIGQPNLNQKARETLPQYSSLRSHGLFLLLSEAGIFLWLGKAYLHKNYSHISITASHTLISPQSLHTLAFLYAEANSIFLPEVDIQIQIEGFESTLFLQQISQEPSEQLLYRDILKPQSLFMNKSLPLRPIRVWALSKNQTVQEYNLIKAPFNKQRNQNPFLIQFNQNLSVGNQNQQEQEEIKIQDQILMDQVDDIPRRQIVNVKNAFARNDVILLVDFYSMLCVYVAKDVIPQQSIIALNLAYQFLLKIKPPSQRVEYAALCLVGLFF